MFPSTRPIWWLPTFGLFLFLSIEAWMFVAGDRIFEDPGVGRHLRTAEVILDIGRIPHTDPLSFSRAGERWMDFEWAFESTLGVLNHTGGLALVKAFCFALFGATILGVYRLLLQSGLSLSSVLLCTGLAFLTLHLHFSARPVLFTYLFMALVVEVWYRQPAPRARDWLILPLVFVAWANIHAGWAAALLFLVLSLAGRWIDRVLGRVTGDDYAIIPWLGLTLLCLLATWVNPWGWALHRQVVLFATTYKSFALWDEYLPPNFSQPSMSAITVLCLLAVTFSARACRRAPLWRAEIVLPLLFFLYQGLKAQRHVLLLMEIAALPMGRDLEVLLRDTWWPLLRDKLRERPGVPLAGFVLSVLSFMGGRLEQFQARQRLAGGDAWLALAAAMVMSALYLQTPVSHRLEVGKSVTPELLTFLRGHPDRFHRPLTTTWNAGPLLWNMRPDFRVSIDDRGDFYGDDAVFDFVHMTAGAPGWRDLLARGRYDSAIIEPYLPLNDFLRSVPGWREVYRDKKTVVYWYDAPPS